MFLCSRFLSKDQEKENNTFIHFTLELGAESTGMIESKRVGYAEPDSQEQGGEEEESLPYKNNHTKISQDILDASPTIHLCSGDNSVTVC